MSNVLFLGLSGWQVVIIAAAVLVSALVAFTFSDKSQTVVKESLGSLFKNLPKGLTAWVIIIASGIVIAFVFSQFMLSLLNSADTTHARNFALILAALLGAPFVMWRAFVAQKQVNIAHEGHMTDRINKAVEQLGAEKTTYLEGKATTKPNLEVRLGAIYALERIAQDSMRDHISVMEILCAYVRNNAPAVKVDSDIAKIPPSPIDIQAVLSVIGRRKDSHIEFEQDARNNPHKRAYALNLSNTNLQGLDLQNLKFDNALLRGAQMQGTNLSGVHMQGANLVKAQMQKAYLRRAQLQGANLEKAQMHGTYLTEAQLQGANLMGVQVGLLTDLTGCVFTTAAVRSVNFGAIATLSDDQIASMFGDSTAILPYRAEPPDWAGWECDPIEYLDKWQAAKKAAAP